MRGKGVEAMKNDERVEDDRREDVVGSKRGRHRGRCWRKLAQKAVASFLVNISESRYIASAELCCTAGMALIVCGGSKEDVAKSVLLCWLQRSRPAHNGLQRRFL